MSENYNLFNYKAQNYTDTSKKAYQNKEYKLKGLREEVYQFLLIEPKTNHQTAEELDMTLQSVCGRCRELQLMDLVFDSGQRRKTSFGGTAIVWQAKRK
jgi:predicted Rossmann fold nucleotide-binding protein DprA/Smf involved in DNA uptake